MQAAGLFNEIEKKLGLRPPMDTRFDGAFTRWGKNKQFWLVAKQLDDKLFATYGDWRTGEKFKWSSMPFTPRFLPIHEELDETIEDEQRKKKEKFRGYFKSIIDSLDTIATPLNCPYMAKKNIPKSKKLFVANKDLNIKKVSMNHDTKRLVHQGFLTIPKGSLIVPIKSTGERCELVGIQYITPEGEKKFLTGSHMQGSSFAFGDVERAHHVFIAEGIGTAGAIANVLHGTDSVVYCAFNCGNMKKVVKILRDWIPSCKIIIAADNDDAGIKAAQKIAQDNNNVVIRYPEGVGKDFADLEEKEIKEGLKITREDFISIKSLGFSDSNYWFFSTYKNGITKCPVHITKPYVLDLAPSKFWIKNYKNKSDGLNVAACGEFLKSLAHNEGQFDSTKLRGSGYFLIQPKGTKLYTASFGRTFMGEVEDKTHITGQKIYIPQKNKDNKSLIRSIQELTDVVSGFCWSNPINGKLLMGWVLTAPFCGSLPFRPHMWLTGDSSSGKSWVAGEIVKPLLSGNSFELTGDSTEAGIRSTLKFDALPIIVDEFESEDITQKKRRQRILELLRQASTETDAAIVKGTSDGKAMVYKIVTSAILFSVRSSLEFEANRNRFVTLSFNKEKQSNQDFKQVTDYLKKLNMKSLKEQNINYLYFNWDKFLNLYESSYYKLKMYVNEHINRCYSVISAALGMYDMELPTKDIIKIVRGLERFSVDEKTNCLNFFITSEIKERGLPKGTVLELVGETARQSTFDDAYRVLQDSGVIYDRITDVLSIATKHPTILKIMGNYADSNWGKSLSSLPDSRFEKKDVYYKSADGQTKLASRGGTIIINSFWKRYGNG